MRLENVAICFQLVKVRVTSCDHQASTGFYYGALAPRAAWRAALVQVPHDVVVSEGRRLGGV
jgi:hypothetical protein